MGGAEPEEFWAALGGKKEYTTAKWLPPPSREPMLFSVSNSTGTIRISPIFDFSQADLEEGDCYILDVYTAVYIWVGAQANDAEKKSAEETAAAYVTAQQLDPDTPILT